MAHSEMKSTGIGVIGAGFHARSNVLPALVLPDVPVVGTAARSIPSAGRAARVLGGDVATYDSAASILADAAVGGAVIVAQPGDQVHAVEEVIRTGCHVLVEKPLGLTTEQSREVARLWASLRRSRPKPQRTLGRPCRKRSFPAGSRLPGWVNYPNPLQHDGSSAPQVVSV
ncbi:Gfo/Idh/MocA family protein [Microbacterium sp. Root553]|uniref:Gfo/Idh/MocA family protein n=1 Tax=Microbacterium sp. Root553 TaxID=1736556 RepID=UPI0006F6A9F5|nr:Gfo/Idh/MocA family oxidoreductase [Microbacterium sp. Root553]KQZ23198.1 hypothetical protein ASD43_01555 [Microbacterium sp. Root553]